jgi:hypothetical protein
MGVGVRARGAPVQTFLHCIHLGMHVCCALPPFCALQTLYSRLQVDEHCVALAAPAEASATMAHAAPASIHFIKTSLSIMFLWTQYTPPVGIVSRDLSPDKLSAGKEQLTTQTPHVDPHPSPPSLSQRTRDFAHSALHIGAVSMRDLSPDIARPSERLPPPGVENGAAGKPPARSVIFPRSPAP